LNKYITYLFFLLAIPGLSIGQELRFQQFTMEDGLSNSGTYWLESIIQDREGFLWFTTFNGLNRFDGKNFKKYQYSQNTPNGLGDNLTTAICEAEDGRIWVGTSSGIYIFDPKTETFELLRHDPANYRSLCGNDINFINKDQDGNMWVGTAIDGVCRWSKATGDFDNFGGYFRDGLVFFQQKNGTIWVGNSDGLHQKIPGRDEFRPEEKFTENKVRTVRYASDIVELPDGNLMVSAHDFGLWIFDLKTHAFTDLTASYYSKFLKGPAFLLTDKSGEIWMGAVGELQSYDLLTGKFKAYRHDEEDPASPPMFKVAYGCQDAAGSLWFVTSGGGVIVSHSPRHPFETVGEIDAGEIIRLDENRLLINSWGGLGVFDIRKNKLVASEIPGDLLKANILSLALSGKKELWVQQSNAGHQKVFNFETGETRLIPGRVPWLKAGPDGRIWSGCKYFDEAQNQWVNVYPKIPGLPDSTKVSGSIVDIHFVNKDVVWLATNFGIFRYNLRTRQGRKYELYPANSRSANVVHKIYPGEAGRFYLATSNGMSMYDPLGDVFLSFNESNGLLHNQVTTVVEDARGNPWITTPKGLHKLDLSNRTFTNYGINDGLPGIHFNYQRAYRDEAGRLYFSIDGKLFRFHPDSLKPKAYVAPVHLLDFYLNHKLVQPGGSGSLLEKQLRFSQNIQLRYDQADFGFSFVMPVFYKAGEVQYFYQLAPYDADWKSARASNEIHYTNMSPGKYTFRVKAKTADGFWSPGEASIDIHIFPPFYRTWWAYLFYLIATGGLLFGIRRFEMRRQSMKAEALRLQELDTLKSRLYTNITHEFRTPLTVIMGMTDNISGYENERKLIQRNSNNLLRLINQMLDLSKLESGAMKMNLVQSDIINYLQYLTESFHSMAHEKKVRLTFYSEIPELVMDFDEEKIQHVVYNLVSNALKFTGEGGKVVLHANQTEHKGLPFLILKVQDTGIGIPEGQLAHIFDRFYQADNPPSGGQGGVTRKGEGTGIGLAFTKELVGLMGGSISVESTPGKGATFTLLLPVRLEAGTPIPETGFQSSRTPVPELAPDLPGKTTSLHTSDATGEVVGEKPLLLIIEDNADVTAYIFGLLEKEYEVHTAPNGQIGIDMAFELVPDIIISDVMMPEKDGYEVCETLKMDERTSHIPIILLTAKAEASDRITGLRKGADAYLMKPFNKEELYVRLEKLLELRRALQKRYAITIEGVTANAEVAEPSLEDLFLQKLQNAVLENLDDPGLGAEQLCRTVHLSQSQLYRKLNALTGEPPNAFIRKIRLHQALEMLTNTQLNISEVAYAVGFNDPNYFSRAFSKEYGKSPGEYRS
jgi:signal transduction histidine kinase/ligand-binding sensor domain-containing protein/DNA-binding response OmpR family regulator